MNEMGNSVKIFKFQDTISNILNRTFTHMLNTNPQYREDYSTFD